MSRQIFITEADRDRLLKWIDKNFDFKIKNREYIEDLELELSRAKVVESINIPGDVITMNSKVLLNFEGADEEVTYTLVYPADAALHENKISVFAPIGTAILGYKEGDVIEWKVPDGVTKITVKKILYQPEAAGDLHL